MLFSNYSGQSVKNIIKSKLDIKFKDKFKVKFRD